MVPFSDVMEFAQAHHPCGGIAPAVRSKSDGGYLLTLTCVCGATFHRDVTPEEAAHLPSVSTAPASPRRTARPRPSPSPELERVMQEALVAAEQPAAAVAPATERNARRRRRWTRPAAAEAGRGDNQGDRVRHNPGT